MKFSGVTRFTLLLASRAAMLMQSCGKKAEKIWVLPYDGADFYDTLEKALARQAYYPLKIIIDAPLDIRRDDLPPAGAQTRKAIIERQRAAHFPDSFLSTSQLEKNKLGEWRVTHIGCADEPWLRDVLDHIKSHAENRMEPLAFFAAEWPHYARQVMPDAGHGWQFVNILTQSMGLRQIVLKDGVPVFTRLQEDTYPSLAQDQLKTRLAAHIKAGRDYLPRLGVAAIGAVPVKLFVPAFLKDMALDDIQLYALDTPQAALVQPEWAADVAWLSVAAAQDHASLPLNPVWLRQRSISSAMRQYASIVLLCFGCLGIFTGVSLLTKQQKAEPPAAFVVDPQLHSALPQPQPKAPPDLTLEAVLYHGSDDWVVWINGDKHAAHDAGKAAAFQLVDVTPQAVLVRWDDGVGGTRDIPLRLRKNVSGLTLK